MLYSDSQGQLDNELLVTCLQLFNQLLHTDYPIDETMALRSSQSHEQIAREAQVVAIRILNTTLRRFFLTQDPVEPTWMEQCRRMRNFLSLPQIELTDVSSALS